MKKSLLLLCFIFCCTIGSFASTVSGTVTLGTTGTAAYPAVTYLIKKSFNSTLGCYVLTMLDSANTNASGEYHFNDVTASAGDLLVKAALTSANSSYSGYIPTYKENSMIWSSAHAASFTLGANNIHMVAGTNPGGPGFIGGSVLVGANKTTAVGDPLSTRELILTTDADVAVGYTCSDAAGHFSFPSLAYGTYKLFGDVMGKNSTPLVITISPSAPSVENISFEENDLNFTGQIGVTTVGKNLMMASVKAYPNPVNNELSITGLSEIAGDKTLILSSVNGVTVVKQTIAGNNETADINCSGLPAGVYVLNVCAGNEMVSFKIVK